MQLYRYNITFMKKNILFILLATCLCMLMSCHNGNEAVENTKSAAADEPEWGAELDSLRLLCLTLDSKDPIAILETLMSVEYVPMHGPIHHCLGGMALLTAYSNAGGDIALDSALQVLMERDYKIPGAACGNLGCCGAALSCGTFMSIITNNSPFATDAWRLSNLCTAQALTSVAEHGGPRCCKRDSYLSVLSTVDFVKEHLGIEMVRADVKCSRQSLNKQCIGKQCPFCPSGIDASEVGEARCNGCANASGCRK